MITRDEILEQVTAQLRRLPEVKSVALHGSLQNGDPDNYSDIDIKIDVSGYDNGKFMLELPSKLADVMKLSYAAYATRFIPELYLVTIHTEGANPFHFVDIECHATPHVSTVERSDVYKIGNNDFIILKSGINCLKSILRGLDASSEIDMVYRLKFLDQSKSSIGKLIEIFSHFKVDPNISVRAVAEECIKLISEDSQLK